MSVAGRDEEHTSRKAFEAIRLKAARQVVDKGKHPEDVAETLGVARSTVYGWVRKYREGGADALGPRPAPGRPQKLTGAQQRHLFDLVTRNDPRDLLFASALWTRDMVRDLVRQRFGVGMSVSAVGRLMHRMGLSPQRPLHRAYQQDPVAVERWKRDEYPAIRAEAKKAGGLVFFGDEATIRSDYHAGTTWAPVGRTPVVAATGARFKLNMVSAVSPGGTLHFEVLDTTFNAARFIEFCEKLVRDSVGRPVFLVVDGHPTHRAKAVRDYVESTNGMLRLYILPSYSPELNPDEWVWKNVKHDRVGRAGVTSKEELHYSATNLHDVETGTCGSKTDGRRYGAALQRRPTYTSTTALRRTP